jgi:hypothetical protein
MNKAIFPGFSYDRPLPALLVYVKPYLIGRAGVPAERTVFDAGSDLFESRQSMIEELPVTLAEIAFPFGVFIIPANPVFHTPTPADIEVSADKALVTEFLLVSGESSFFAISGKFLQRCIDDVA